jgi:glycosyltransferase involved in cell wall biosynthesis
MKILRLVDSFPVRGEASYGLQPVFLNLSLAQVKRGHDVIVISKRRQHEPYIENFSGINIHRVRNPYSLSSLLTVKDLGTGDSLIHTHATSGFIFSFLRKVTKMPLLCHVHGTTYSAATPATLKFGSIKLNYSRIKVAISYIREKRLWKSADIIAAVSSSVKRDLVERYDVDERMIRTVYNGVDVNLFKKIEEPKVEKIKAEGKRIILYVGHFGFRKGLHHLIEAMKFVKNEYPDSLLICVGGVPPWLGSFDFLGYLKEITRRKGLDGSVIFLDRVKNSDLPSYYSLSEVLVLPSYYEAFPKVLVEAMACEVPVISSSMGGVSDSVQNMINGYLVQYGNVKQISDAIISILSDKRKAREMGRKGREIVVERFTWDKVAERIDSAYKEILGN